MSICCMHYHLAYMTNQSYIPNSLIFIVSFFISTLPVPSSLSYTKAPGEACVPICYHGLLLWSMIVDCCRLLGVTIGIEVGARGQRSLA
jgi:hypothetical protein